MKLLLTTICLLMISLPSFADQVFMEPFNPVTPEVTAQGRAFTAVAEGYNALFTNPAGFSRSATGISLLSVEGGINTSLSALGQVLSNLSAFQTFNPNNGTANSAVSLVNNIVTKYGFGGNFAAGIGWVGGNLGIGLAIQGRTFQKGLNVLNANGPFDITEGLVLGYSVPFDLHWAKLDVGLDVRPMQRTFNDNIYLVDILGTASNLSNLSVYNGFGLAWDWGTLLDFGLTPAGYWTAGLSLRDIGSTVFNFSQYVFSDVTKSWGFASGSTTSPVETYRIPMTVNVGGSWSPDMGVRKVIIDPRLEFDLQIPIEDQFTQPSLWTWIHVGGQVKFLNFLSVRAGLNQGYLTFGVGIKVFVVDLNASIYTDELGRFAGSYPRSAATVEAAVRF